MRLENLVACLLCCISSTSIAAEPNLLSREELQTSLSLLEASAQTYIEKRKCFTCHHQALPAMTFAAARKVGFEISKDRAARQTEFTSNYFNARIDRVKMANGVPGGPYTAGYALLSLSAHEINNDETTDALISYLKQTQKEDGSWRIRTHRPPLEDSDFTATALSIQSLKLYGRPNDSELNERISRATVWLNTAEAKSTEDAAFRLWGLHASQIDDEAIKPFQDTVLQLQRDDGGWAQLPKMNSDAYATGQALVALKTSGIATNHAAFQAGLKYLKSIRKLDGSWHVKTRSRPIQTYFESGFPHGKDQFISICATSWATMAFLAAMESK